MVQGGAEGVGQDKDGGPGGVLQQPTEEDLGCHHPRHDVGEVGVRTHQLLDLRVPAEDFHPAGGVRFLCVLPVVVAVVVGVVVAVSDFGGAITSDAGGRAWRTGAVGIHVSQACAMILCHAVFNQRTLLRPAVLHVLLCLVVLLHHAVLDHAVLTQTVLLCHVALLSRDVFLGVAVVPCSKVDGADSHDAPFLSAAGRCTATSETERNPVLPSVNSPASKIKLK